MTDDPIPSSTSLPDTAGSRSPSRLFWPTPAVFDTTGGPYPTQLTQQGFVSFHNGVPHGAKLSDAVNAEVLRTAPSPSPKSTPTPVPSSPTAGLMSPTSAPFSQSPEIQSLRLAVSSRLSSLVDSLASRTPSPASAGASSTPATSGMSASECFGIYDPALPSSRTLRDSSPPVAIPMPRMVNSAQDFFSTAFVQTWPRFGTLANGKLYRQPTLERPTAASASGSSVSMNSDWPTAAARDYKGARSEEAIAATGRNPMTNSLEDAIQAVERSGPPRTDSGLPVPASDSTSGSRAESWATPSASEGTGAGQSAAKQGAPNLRTQVLEDWPTPASRGSEGGGPSGMGGGTGGTQKMERIAPGMRGKLNPSWVETLMGLPLGWTQLPQKFVKPKKATT